MNVNKALRIQVDFYISENSGTIYVSIGCGRQILRLYGIKFVFCGRLSGDSCIITGVHCYRKCFRTGCTAVMQVQDKTPVMWL